MIIWNDRHLPRKIGPRRGIVQSITLLVLTAATPAAARQDAVVTNPTELPELVLNNTNGPPFTTNEGDGFLDRVARAMFRRAGYRLRLVVLPPERGLRNANAGIEDGDLTRIAGIERRYPNLVPVPETLVNWHFSAFTRQAEIIAPEAWKSLLPYAVGIIKGWKIAEVNLAGARNIVFVDNVDRLFRLLIRDRVDTVVYSKEMGQLYLKRRGLQDIRPVEPPLESRDMFIYLHKKHAALVPKLVQALRALKADGSYERFYRESVTHVLAIH